MKGKFVEITVDNFLRLLPAHGGMPNVEHGDFDWSTGKESTLYNPFVRTSSLFCVYDVLIVLQIEHMTPYLKSGWPLGLCQHI